MKKLLQKLLASTPIPARFQKGQILILVAFASIAIIAVIGLALDVGNLFVQYARLRRAVDAAALAAALQDRIGATHADLNRSADEFLTLNGIDRSTANVDDCSTLPSLCTTPARKQVEVTAQASVALNFLSILSYPNPWTVTLNAQAISEAASVDVVLVIDTSESMTYDAGPGVPARDPSYCNNPVNATPCQPFQGLKDAAKLFVSKLFFPYDRVALIDFNQTATDDLDWTSDEPTVDAAIDALTVFEAHGVCPAAQNPCRQYAIGHPGDSNFYQGFGCTGFPGNPDPENCTSTNTGAALILAGSEFAVPPIREDALWVTILLTDGAANAAGGGTVGAGCPNTASNPTWYPSKPLCRAQIATVRHCLNDANVVRCTTPAPAGEFGDPKRLSLATAHGVWQGGGSLDPPSYDAMDYARDAADFVYIDQHSIIYTIGLGPLVSNDTFGGGDPAAGEKFLKYAARDGEPNGGQYYYAPTGAQLGAIFQSIANNIATKLNK